ncbi:MAG: M20/M25/M40 family metallo-hydrolase [Bacteroidota bacterium]
MNTFTRSTGGFLLFLVSTLSMYSQTPDSAQPYVAKAKEIITTGLGSGRAYEFLSELTKIGPRLSGSPQAALAVDWARRKMEELGFENVHLEPVMVPHWVRGPVEEASVVNSRTSGNVPLKVCALGGSIATPEEGVTAEVMEVKSFEELQARKGEAVRKIIFFNRPMDRSKISPFEAYGGAVNQRSQGPIEAAKVGGVAALIRSMTTRMDDVPHTGSTHYVDSIPKIPAAAISTVGAELLSALIARENRVAVRLKLTCQTLPDAESANVIGELTGSEKPQEVVVIGAHLDSWDKGQGAHDDGAGCVQVLEALRLFKDLGLRPKRTVRAVLFMNEENGLRGGKAYAEKERQGEKPILAIESDAGGFSPRGFGVEADSNTFEEVAHWADLLKPIDADRIWKGGGGADISALGKKGVPLAGLSVDPQRYFDYHHSDSDTIDKVNERELELGAAAIAVLSYVVAEEGLDVDRISRHAGTR